MQARRGSGRQRHRLRGLARGPGGRGSANQIWAVLSRTWPESPRVVVHAGPDPDSVAAIQNFAEGETALEEYITSGECGR